MQIDTLQFLKNNNSVIYGVPLFIEIGNIVQVQLLLIIHISNAIFLYVQTFK